MSLNINLDMIIYRYIHTFHNIYVIEFKGNVGFLPDHSVTTTDWISRLPKCIHEINKYICNKKKKNPFYQFM